MGSSHPSELLMKEADKLGAQEGDTQPTPSFRRKGWLMYQKGVRLGRDRDRATGPVKGDGKDTAKFKILPQGPQHSRFSMHVAVPDLIPGTPHGPPSSAE